MLWRPLVLPGVKSTSLEILDVSSSGLGIRRRCLYSIIRNCLLKSVGCSPVLSSGTILPMTILASCSSDCEAVRARHEDVHGYWLSLCLERNWKPSHRTGTIATWWVLHPRSLEVSLTRFVISLSVSLRFLLKKGALPKLYRSFSSN